MENGIGGGLVKGTGQDPRRGRQEREHGLEGRAGEAAGRPPGPPGGAGVLRGAEAAAAATKTLPRFAPGRWLPHFEKHAAEFGYRTPVEYLRGARDLVGRSGVQTFIRANGDRLFYDAARNEFAVLKPTACCGRTSGLRTAASTGGSRPADERTPRTQPGRARGARAPARRAGPAFGPRRLALRHAPPLERLRDRGRARLRRLDLRVHQRPLRPRSARRRRRGRRPRAARQARSASLPRTIAGSPPRRKRRRGRSASPRRRAGGGGAACPPGGSANWRTTSRRSVTSGSGALRSGLRAHRITTPPLTTTVSPVIVGVVCAVQAPCADSVPRLRWERANGGW